MMAAEGASFSQQGLWPCMSCCQNFWVSASLLCCRQQEAASPALTPDSTDYLTDTDGRADTVTRHLQPRLPRRRWRATYRLSPRRLCPAVWASATVAQAAGMAADFCGRGGPCSADEFDAPAGLDAG